MEKLLENLKEAIKHYEYCEDVCAAESIMANSLYKLGYYCQEVDKKCQAIVNTMFD